MVLRTEVVLALAIAAMMIAFPEAASTLFGVSVWLIAGVGIVLYAILY